MAGLCSLNLTIGVIAHRDSIVFENKVTGLNGKHFDNFLVHKNQR